MNRKYFAHPDFFSCIYVICYMLAFIYSVHHIFSLKNHVYFIQKYKDIVVTKSNLDIRSAFSLAANPEVIRMILGARNHRANVVVVVVLVLPNHLNIQEARFVCFCRLLSHNG